MASNVYEVRARPELSEVDGDIYHVAAESPTAAFEAVRAQVGPDWIIEIDDQPISDERAQHIGLTDGFVKLG